MIYANDIGRQKRRIRVEPMPREAPAPPPKEREPQRREAPVEAPKRRERVPA